MAKPNHSGLKLIERLRSDSERQLQFRPPEEPRDEDEYAGIGAILRQTRERLGLDLFSVASVLRIQVPHLDAIESGDFQRLPGATYAIGFLRSYANYLGMDAGMVVQRFKEETEIAPTQAKLVFPEPVEETRRPGMRAALVTLLIAAGVYGGWVYLERHGDLEVEAVAEPPQRYAHLIEEGEAENAEPPAVAPSVVPTRTTAADPVPEQPAPEQPLTEAPAEQMPADKAADVSQASQQAAEGLPQPALPEQALRQPAVPDENTALAALPEQARPASENSAQAVPETAPAPRADSVPTPTRVQVSPADPPEAIARADAVAEQGSAEDGASAVERAAAEEVASIANANQEVPRAETSQPAMAVEADTPQSAESVDTVEARETVLAEVAPLPEPRPEDQLAPLPRPVLEDPDGLSGAMTRSNTVPAEPSAATVDIAPPAPTSDGEEDSAPPLPQIQARIEPPQPPSMPAAPPPAPRVDGTASGSETAAGAAADSSGRRYRPQIYGVSTADARVVVRATADSWVQVQGANNELLLTRILRAGDTYYAPDREDLVLMTGNAGAIEVVVDGETLGTLGPPGAVRRNIALYADSLRTFVQERGTLQR